MKANLTVRDFELFSAYLDGQLSPAEIKRLEEQLDANPEWREALSELEATRRLLRSAPRYRAPRNFTISAETARSLKPKRQLFPAFPVFRLSSALAALSVLAVVILQVVGLRAPAAANLVAMAPAMEAAPMENSAQKTAGEEPEYTFQWTQPQGFGGGDGTGVSEPAGSMVTGKYPSSGGIVTYGDQQPQPAAGGMGGGGGTGAIVLPPNALPSEKMADGEMPSRAGTAEASPPSQSAPQVEQPSAERYFSTVIEGGGPILGLPAPGEGGKVIDSSADETPVVRAEGETGAVLPPVRMAQIALGILAVLAAAAAVFFRARRI